MRRWLIDVVLLIGLAVWLFALVGGSVPRLAYDLHHWAFVAFHALGPAILLLLVARASPRRLVDFTLMLLFGLWLVWFQVGEVGIGRLIGDLPSWVLRAWYYIGPAALMILVVRAWIARGDSAWPLLGQQGEPALLVGFAVWCVVLGFLGTVMIGLIVLMLLGPVALGSTFAGVYQARERTGALHWQAIGLALLLLGLVGLLWIGSGTGSVAQGWALASLYADSRGSVPSLTAWAYLAGGWTVTALFWGLGLRLWAGWPAGRSVAWGLAVLGIPMVGLAVYGLVLLTHPVLYT